MMKTTMLYWDRREGKTNEIIDIIHNHKKSSQKKLMIIMGPDEVKRIKTDYNLPINTKITTFGSLKNGSMRGETPDIIIIDNAEYLDEKIFNSEIRPMLSKTKELILTGSDISLFKHYRQPEDIKFIQDAKEFIYSIKKSLYFLEQK